jgi:hypothetical protein
MECKQKSNSASCPCTYNSCPRKGICCECIAYHRASNEIPGCYFSREQERVYDRSIEFFIKSRH